RFHVQTTDLPARRVACGRPHIFAVLVIVKVDVFETDSEGDVEFAQVDQKSSAAAPSDRDELLAPRKEREMGSVRQLKTPDTLPVTLGFATEPQSTQFAFP